MPNTKVSDQASFAFASKRPRLTVIEGAQQECTVALEGDDFPFERISDVAEAESWRKEINRPIYHVHKWWAQRLGSVFRAIVLGAFTPESADIMDLFYRTTSLPGRTVFDPFMGSGTTLGETLKLGANAIGRDINPVAHFLVRNGLAQHPRAEVLRIFDEIEKDTSEALKAYYQTKLPNGRLADVLYYFWVKELDCPDCGGSVELFSSRIFAQHAYKKKFPKSQSTCPHCGEVNEVKYDDITAECRACHQTYNPQEGPASGQTATCPHCESAFSISKTIRGSTLPPRHKMYAKLVLLGDGTKQYQRITDFDRALYEKATADLARRPNAFPVVPITSGHNTNQAIGYNYLYWHQMFNDRQLLCLSMLGSRIQKIEEPALRDLFMCLFSGALEFNNMFASYKGEGTGAVRHMFAHHVLKPERVPLEANLWGTPKSSGSFSTMFAGRILRAIEYAENPFELKISKGGATNKAYGVSEPMGYDISGSYADFSNGKRVYLSCGDSSQTDILSKSVDAIISDPPFFDNVNYSELADFFHVWQRHFQDTDKLPTTRSSAEVQNPDVAAFTDRLGGVWAEAHRVLKDKGLLAFTYHHSRSEGWSSVLSAVMHAGFQITATQPVKAEMSVAMPKLQAKEPIDLDIIIVCRKRESCGASVGEMPSYLAKAEKQVARFMGAGRKLSRNDIRIILMGQLIRVASALPSESDALEMLADRDAEVTEAIERLHKLQSKA